MRFRRALLLAPLLMAACSRPVTRSENLDGPPPSDEERLRRTMDASEQGPGSWSPAVTIPLYPVLLVADTSIKFAKATVRWFQALFGAGEEPLSEPERLKRQAEELRRR